MATIVLTNGHVYPMDRQTPRCTAVALRDDKILAVGNDEAMRTHLGPGGEWIDLQGRCVIPGLVDAHVHFESLAIYRQRVDLDGAASLAEALRRVAAYAESQVKRGHPENGWLEGRGWAQDSWAEQRFPTAAELDQVVSERPACLRHKSGHAAWVNSRALQVAGINATTPDPSGGQIQRDAGGQPTGVLFEEAMKLVTRLIPRPTERELVSAMREAQAYCWELGLTGIHDFDGRSCFLALQTMRLNQELGLRFVKNIPLADMDHAIGVGLRSGFGDPWLRIGGIKIFADGALGPRTAAMIEGYEDEPQNRGLLLMEKEELIAVGEPASRHGFSLTIHAIGDRANHEVLDMFEHVRRQEAQEGRAGKLRHRIEHVQVLHPMDLQRLGELQIIASMQPIHATSDMLMADRYWGNRARYAYAWRSMLDSGAHLVFGTDAPVEPIDPRPGLFAAVTRRRADGSPGLEGWHPQQRLTLPEALHAYTAAAAYTSGQEQQFGTLSPGKYADLTIFEEDILALEPQAILETPVAATIVGGAFRYRSW